MTDEKNPDKSECVIPPQMDIETASMFVMPQPEHEARDIAEYVEGQARDETVMHCELIKTEFVTGTRYDVWDVHTDKNRWWVITNATNLYRQKEFTSLDYTLSFHIGLMARVAARRGKELDPETADMVAVFRKMEQILGYSGNRRRGRRFPICGTPMPRGARRFVSNPIVGVRGARWQGAAQGGRFQELG